MTIPIKGTTSNIEDCQYQSQEQPATQRIDNTRHENNATQRLDDTGHNNSQQLRGLSVLTTETVIDTEKRIDETGLWDSQQHKD